MEVYKPDQAEAETQAAETLEQRNERLLREQKGPDFRADEHVLKEPDGSMQRAPTTDGVL